MFQDTISFKDEELNFFPHLRKISPPTKPDEPFYDISSIDLTDTKEN